ncbi:MAG: DnaJ domain-containing protein [Heteroscytonema crispum UTEX LB 1556]
MSLKLDRGLFKYDLIDHHAILCIPVDADVKDIRKRYLKIARRLHPDSIAAASEAEKKVASELLSKLVNPAYEKLSADRTRAEYMILLSQVGKRMVQESASVELSTDVARQLAGSPNFDAIYRNAIAKIAETQYDSLQQVAQVIAHTSELNLVYLMRTAGKSFAAPPPPPPAKTNTGTSAPNTAATKTPAPPPREDSAVAQYMRRAQELISKNQLAPARVELQDALKLEPSNSRCHSLIGLVYLKQNQLKMAKVHFDRALQLDPQDQTALEWKPKIEKALGQQSSSGSNGSKMTSSPTGNQQPNKSRGGLFGGLFGGKKK